MKDKIFIIWSGTNEIALKVKHILETKNYKCTIGGNADNSSTFASVGDTVIQQIKSCNQAIIIFQNRADGMVSNNLFFELGYVLASYGQPKIHCVKRADEAVVLPSDFDNSFVENIPCSDDEQFVNGIIDYFFARQKMSINTNKMLLINNRYKMHDYIQRHFSELGSKCSDYELAQYILFYMQAGHMFGDERKVQRELTKFRDDNHAYFSDELSTAVDIALSFFDMVLNIKTADNGEFYIDRATYRRCRDTMLKCREDLTSDDTGSFREWANAILSDHISYSNSLYMFSPELDEERMKKIAQRCIEWSTTAIADLDNLQNKTPVRDNNDHKGLISLMYSYAYRNLFISCRITGDGEGELKWLEKTLKERTSLKNTFTAGSIDSQLYDNFAMEYFLSLAEYLHYADRLGLDEDDIDYYRDEIKKYIDECNKRSDQRKYLERIEMFYRKG